MVSRMRPASDFDRIASNIAIWHDYDSTVKAELYSTCLITPDSSYFIDPIPLRSEALDKLVAAGRVAGIIVTNCNHHRASARFAEQFAVPVLAYSDAFPGHAPRQFMRVANGDEICDGLHVIGIEGAAPGEIVLHYAADGGTLIIGDALMIATVFVTTPITLIAAVTVLLLVTVSVFCVVTTEVERLKSPLV